MTSATQPLPQQLPPARVRTRVRVPLHFGDGFQVDAEVTTFHELSDGAEHLALGLGDPVGAATPLVRLHSECLTGDVFGSARCDCGPQLRESVERIARQGGYLLYLRQEGRGIGLYNKLDAYALQDGGLDTYAANAALGLPEDARDYTAAAQMLHTLRAPRIELLSNNPAKAAQLAAHGITIARRVPTGVHASPSNLHYLRTKAQGTPLTLGHGIRLQPQGS
ncbi:GTP cyclohydrolase II [Kitasatospora kifunensis]|uniref:GTP cyclohydrolase-2 n=1 Tax=Kitasatospora kifunensis TaxID=58351 RepID=A0A7W7VSP5_KITKI|nr:GTP cyclohydrolase II [Kitasatospora kifunensis]MBB4921372.1 GTP cyclohydrolase II [Kitasatospora kifunensis]